MDSFAFSGDVEAGKVVVRDADSVAIVVSTDEILHTRTLL